MFIGKQIKDLREQKGMKLIDLAAKSGVQIATLSRIENLKMTGTLESHMQIAKALDVDITTLYSNIVATKEEALTAEQAPKEVESSIFSHNDKASFEILTSNIMRKKMMPVILKVEPSGQTNKEQNKIGSEKFIFVLEGVIELYIGSDKFYLKKGQSLYFDASKEHFFKNSGKNTAKIICVQTPVTL